MHAPAGSTSARLVVILHKQRRFTTFLFPGCRLVLRCQAFLTFPRVALWHSAVYPAGGFSNLSFAIAVTFPRKLRSFPQVGFMRMAVSMLDVRLAKPARHARSKSSQSPRRAIQPRVSSGGLASGDGTLRWALGPRTESIVRWEPRLVAWCHLSEANRLQPSFMKLLNSRVIRISIPSILTGT